MNERLAKRFSHSWLDSKITKEDTQLSEKIWGYFTGPCFVYMAYYAIAGTYLTQFYTDVLGIGGIFYDPDACFFQGGRCNHKYCHGPDYRSDPHQAGKGPAVDSDFWYPDGHCRMPSLHGTQGHLRCADCLDHSQLQSLFCLCFHNLQYEPCPHGATVHTGYKAA